MPVSLASVIQACRAAFDAGDFELVLKLTDLLIRAQPRRVEPWTTRAEAFIALERAGEAADAYAMAVERAPDDGPLLVRYGRALARCGRHQEALAAHEAAFAVQPSLLSALHDLLAYRTMSPEDPRLQTVRAMATGAPSTPGARAFACFLLGRIHSQAGDDAKTFSYYASANQLIHAGLDRESPPRGPIEFQNWWAQRLVEGMALPAADAGDDIACPAVLVTGLPRSGKSLVEHLLSSHPALAPGGELGGLHESVEACAGSPLQRLEQLERRSRSGDGGPGHHYRQALATSAKTGARLIVDTTPSNLWDLGYLAALHPQVPLIFCRRDPLDLGAAIFFKRFRHGHAYSYDQTTLGSMLALAEQAMERWQRHLPNPIQTVDYDALVADPIAERDRLLKGLGLDPRDCVGVDRDRQAPSRLGDRPPPLHPSHSAEGYGPIVADLSGFGRRYAGALAKMRAAYAQSLDVLKGCDAGVAEAAQVRDSGHPVGRKRS